MTKRQNKTTLASVRIRARSQRTPPPPPDGSSARVTLPKSAKTNKKLLLILVMLAVLCAIPLELIREQSLDSVISDTSQDSVSRVTNSTLESSQPLVVDQIRGVDESVTVFCDGFDDPELNPQWTWIDPLGDSDYSLTENPGSLRISTSDGGHDLYQNLDAPRVLAQVRDDFEVMTKVTINPSYNYQGAGLLIWDNEINYVRLDRTLVRGVNMGGRNGGEHWAKELSYSASPTVYLKFQRSGDIFTGWFSEDKSSWILVSSIVMRAPITLHVGLDLINQWQDNPIEATYDFFYLNCRAQFD